MRFKHRIWLLPIMTAVIVSAGIAVNSRITSRASAALERVQQVQYPTVEAMRSLRAEVTKIQETLQQAVAEGDHTAVNAAAEHAVSVRNTLKELAKLEDPDGRLSSKLSDQFESYYAAATTATGILLGTDKGDSAKAVADMQATIQSLNSLLSSSNDTALANFHGLLSGSADDVRETLKVSVIAAAIMLVILGAGSWILIGSVFGKLGVEPEAAVDIVRRIADGDFTAKVDVRLGDNSSLLHGISTLKSKLGDLIRDVHRSCAAVDAAAGGMNTAMNELSERTSGQAASLEETAASMEKMTATIKQNANNTRHATEVAMAARTQAEVGGEVVNRAVSAMSQINSSSKKIADIIGVIDEIAFQTNLLALNAAVEAARAGEQGRGFAVVASEVRNLAQRSSSAAREIKNLIQDSVVKVQDGQKLVNESGQHLNDIVTSVKKVADIITEMASASQAQSLDLDQVNKAVMQMDQVTQQNAAMVDQTSAVAQTMTDQAKQLTAIVGVFRIDSDHATPASAAARHAGQEEQSSVVDHHAWQEVA